jgi:hypothetical protein
VLQIEKGKSYWVDINAIRMQVIVEEPDTVKGWWQCVTVPVGTRLFVHESSFKVEADAPPQRHQETETGRLRHRDVEQEPGPDRGG